MAELMRPIPFRNLMKWSFTELKDSKSIFGVRQSKFYKNTSNTKINIFGDDITSPVGPAAGPNSQLAQNIIASYLGGARFMELKTVQIMDGEELRNCVPRPCINAEDECYNVEWSTELYVEEAMNEYIKAWFALHVLAKELGLAEERDFVFNISLGYDLEGIKSEKINNYVESMKDASNTAIWKECKQYLLDNIDNYSFDAAYVESISPAVSPSVTLSTLHGCPPEEIERISTYLLSEKKMYTYIKCNPTLLGYEFARSTVDAMGYDYLSFDDHHFNADLQWKDAVPMFHRLIELANSLGLEFGLKLTNTFPVKIERDELPGEEMYMSGRSLYPLSLSLARRITNEFKGLLPISYSGGADAFNIEELVKTGIRPITVATTVLKPGGYERFNQLAKIAEPFLQENFKGIDVELVNKLADEAVSHEFHLKDLRSVGSRKTESELELFDCFKAPCKDGGCPIEQQIPEYLKLVSEGKFEEAFAIIAIDNAAPGITGTICDHQCQNKCTRLDYEQPLQIRNAKKHAVENAMDQFNKNIKVSELKTDKKVAVIGAGAAGISTALFLRRNGVEVTVFEKRDRPFGIVEIVIPEFRIPAEMIKRDYDMAVNAGVKFVFNADENYSVENLKKEYDFVAIGTGSWMKGNNPLAEGGERALEALPYLEEMKEKDCNVDLGKNVLIVGGGDVSMDCARTASRAPGVEKVTLIYRRDKYVMPATPEERRLALGDGVEIMFLTAPVSYDGKTLVLQRNKLENNRPVDTGERFEMAVDTIINAIGTKIETKHYVNNGIELNEWGYPVVNNHNETSVENVYLAGDGKAGAATVVKAIADGKVIAKDILYKLGLDNDFVRVEVPQPVEVVEFKKGILTAATSEITDGARCLTCDQVCDLCTDVCPNRANVSIKVDSDLFGQGTQIIHVDGMCNECGNCGVFCPHKGLPYKDKVTVFWTEHDFVDSTNKGFLKVDENTFKFRNEKGEILTHKVGETNISQEMKAMLDAVVDNYSYLMNE
jgi:putative selenate reductase